ncbi:MAG: hypothetical protein JSR33_12025, partial [Proteobacteria bacterium]|nr:hypothetical protein [Pseudomonadota bacterium]
MSKMQLSKVIVLFICFFLCQSGLAAPENPSYQMEIIIYAHFSQQALQSEFWSQQQPISIPTKAIEINSEQLGAPTRWQLSPLQQNLKKNGYTILLHTAWVFSASQAQQGQVIHLQSDQDNQNTLNGVLAIGLDRYFNVKLNLQFSVPWQSLNNGNLTNIEHYSN